MKIPATNDDIDKYVDTAVYAQVLTATGQQFTQEYKRALAALKQMEDEYDGLPTAIATGVLNQRSEHLSQERIKRNAHTNP